MGQEFRSGITRFSASGSAGRVGAISVCSLAGEGSTWSMTQSVGRLPLLEAVRPLPSCLQILPCGSLLRQCTTGVPASSKPAGEREQDCSKLEYYKHNVMARVPSYSICHNLLIRSKSQITAPPHTHSGEGIIHNDEYHTVAYSMVQLLILFSQTISCISHRFLKDQLLSHGLRTVVCLKPFVEWDGLSVSIKKNKITCSSCVEAPQDMHLRRGMLGLISQPPSCFPLLASLDHRHRLLRQQFRGIMALKKKKKSLCNEHQVNAKLLALVL